ncbi:hypothetical protein JCM8097_003799 [Rhodosporidiobolus ruineniae]
MSATASASVAKVTATLVGAAHATITTTLPAAPTSSAAPASIFDPRFPSNPVHYDSANPLVLFITQAFIIVALSRVLHFFLRYLRQPKVISEIIAGILIGPTAFGRTPGFTATIFPSQSIPLINLVANLGLVLFLFLVGCEVDFNLIRRNFKVATSISVLGLVIPFALGAAVAKGIYDKFVDPSKSFGVFLLFIGTANAITAFPVLARILTDENLLSDPIGVIVLGAGVGNDVVGWVLLALAIALTSSSSGIVVLYIILTSIGWILLLWFVGRPALKFVGRKTRSFGEHGPSQTMTAFVLFLVLTSAWITDRIGIHAIFGAFLVGLIVPKEIRGSLTEKIEDLVTVLLLPLYFALSGLKTDLGLLRDGSIWGWVVCVCVVAFLSKFLSCGGVARAFGMTWRESGGVGSLMACKGLVELIVLNIGLSAGILNNQVFAMFVVMALVTTFVTTPLTLAFYPVWYRQQQDRLRRGLPPTGSSLLDGSTGFADEARPRSRIAVVLEGLEQVPAVMAFLRLVQPVTVPTVGGKAIELDGEKKQRDHGEKEKKDEKRRSLFKGALDKDGHKDDSKDSEADADASTDDEAPSAPVPSGPPSSKALTVSALRLVELTDRTSTLLRSAESESSLLRADALSHLLRAFAAGLGTALKPLKLALVAPREYPRAVSEFAEEHGTELVCLPWALKAGLAGEEGGVAEGLVPNPLEALFAEREGTSVGVQGAVGYAGIVRRVFAEAPCDVALVVDRSSSATLAAPLANRMHLHLTFYGGGDDRLALSLLVQLVASNPGTTATVLRLTRAPEPTDADREVLDGGLSRSGTALTSPPITREDAPLFFSTVAGGDTVYQSQLGGNRAGTHQGGVAGAGLQSESADEALLARFFDSASASSAGGLVDPATGARISVTEASTAQPLRFANAKLAHLRAALGRERIPLTLLVGRGRRDAPSHTLELGQLLKEEVDAVRASVLVSSEVRRALGDAATAAVLGREVGTEREGEERVVVLQKRGKGGRVATDDSHQRYPFVYTTSAAFHGKPHYSPPPNSPSSRSRHKKVEQGLPSSHPLVQWRDTQLREHEAPKQGAGHDWLLVEGIKRRSEEEGLREGEEGVRGVVLGVADGVGGWEDQGVDPSHYAQALMWFARERVRLASSSSSAPSKSSWTWPAEASKRNGGKVRELLQGAYEDVKGEKGVVAGSSTACLAVLDAETGKLHATNLGDSGFLVLRPSDAPASSSSSESSDSSASTSTPSYALHYSEPPQIHFFNAPYQLSKFPSSEDTSNALLNYPRDSSLPDPIQLQDGDVVLLVTDGFSDNVFDRGEADLLATAVRQKVEAHFDALVKETGRAEPSRAEFDAEFASALARTAVAFARMISVREDKVTPFEVESRKWGAGGKGGFKGGKVDDVTVVVAVVREVKVEGE